MWIAKAAGAALCKVPGGGCRAGPTSAHGFEWGHPGAGQRVGALILGVAGMALDPFPFH
jgi:hypothetical protein